MFDKTVPANLVPKNIGRVVSVQVFERNGDGTIDHDTLDKCVGRLQAYHIAPQGIQVMLEGNVSVTIDHDTHILEVFVWETL